MRHLNGSISLHQDHMSPQIMLRRHASSAAVLLERKDKATVPAIRSDGGHQSMKKRTPPARPPLPARLRSISHQPLPDQLSEFRGALRDGTTTNLFDSQVYVSSTSRICFARTLDGLVEKASSSSPPSCPFQRSTRGAHIQAIRNVTFEARIETQAVACWLEGLCLFSPSAAHLHILRS